MLAFLPGIKQSENLTSPCKWQVVHYRQAVNYIANRYFKEFTRTNVLHPNESLSFNHCNRSPNK